MILLDTCTLLWLASHVSKGELIAISTKWLTRAKKNLEFRGLKAIQPPLDCNHFAQYPSDRCKPKAPKQAGILARLRSFRSPYLGFC